jgi:hypothetical protein
VIVLAAALAEPVGEIAAAVRTASAVYADETVWRQAGQRRWPWVVVTATTTCASWSSSRRPTLRGMGAGTRAPRTRSD